MALLQGPQLLATSHCHDDPAPGVLLVLWTFQRLHSTLGRTRPSISSGLISFHWPREAFTVPLEQLPPPLMDKNSRWQEGLTGWSRADLFKATYVSDVHLCTFVRSFKAGPACADLCCEKCGRLELFWMEKQLFLSCRDFTLQSEEKNFELKRLWQKVQNEVYYVLCFSIIRVIQMYPSFKVRWNGFCIVQPVLVYSCIMYITQSCCTVWPRHWRESLFKDVSHSFGVPVIPSAVSVHVH